MSEKYIQDYTIEHSMDTADLFDSIAQELQDDNELDMSFDDIVELLQSSGELHKFIDVTFRISVDMDNKKIIDIY